METFEDFDAARIGRRLAARVLLRSVLTYRQDQRCSTSCLAASQVLKFSESGTQLQALGEALVPSHDDKHFCKPTAVSALLSTAACGPSLSC